MPKGPYMDYDKGGVSKHDAKNAPVKKFGGNQPIHDGIVSSAGSTMKVKSGAYEKGQGKLAEGPEE